MGLANHVLSSYFTFQMGWFCVGVSFETVNSREAGNRVYFVVSLSVSQSESCDQQC